MSAGRMAAALLWLAGAAGAQEIAFSPDATGACLAAAKEPAGREACIGRSADACAGTPDGQTTVGMGFCYGAERDWWDRRLNAAYEALMKIEEASDREMTALGSAALRALSRR